MNSSFHKAIGVLCVAVVRLLIGLPVAFCRFAFGSPLRLVLAGVAAYFSISYVSASVVPPYLSWVAHSLERQPLGVPLLALESLLVLYFFGRWLMVFTQPEHPVASRVVRATGEGLEFAAGSVLVVLGVIALLFALGAHWGNSHYWWQAVHRIGKEPFFLVTIGAISAWFFAWLWAHRAMQVEQVLDAERVAQICARCHDFDPRPQFDNEEVFVGREV
ncbi:MAG: hypothetical protein RI988_929 [Pseudomonadota bacterium]|jgi:hypothetical protein